MSNNNLELWQLVQETDTKYTKKAKIGQVSITAIDPQYQKMTATKTFGPYGIGWGLVTGTESTSVKEYSNKTEIMTYTAILFYKWKGERGEIPIGAQIQSAYVTKQGSGYLLIDSEALKKVRTNAITKGLSELGFNADVFLGEFDDINYVNEIAKEQGNEKQTEAEQKSIKKVEEFEKSINTFFNILGESKNMTSLNQVNWTYQNQIKRKCEELGYNPEIYLTKLEEIRTKTETKINGVAK